MTDEVRRGKENIQGVGDELQGLTSIKYAKHAEDVEFWGIIHLKGFLTDSSP